MSYDVSIGGSDAEPNYTRNLSKLLYTHIPDTGKGGGLREIDNVRNQQVVGILTNFLVSVAKETAEIGGMGAMNVKYSPSNKWGNVEGCVTFVQEIIAEAIKNPDEITTVSF